LIAKNYGKYFKYRDSVALRNRYNFIRRKKEPLKYYREKAKLLEGKFELINDVKYTESVKWDERETLNLVHAVKQLGKNNWVKIHATYKNYFHENRTYSSLKKRYETLEKKGELLKYFL